jgi:hypothetical protein
MTIISQTSTQSKKKNIDNAMLIVIEFVANTNYEIQIQIIKTCCKLYYIHKRKHKILKAPKLRELKNVKTPKTNQTLIFCSFMGTCYPNFEQKHLLLFLYEFLVFEREATPVDFADDNFFLS